MFWLFKKTFFASCECFHPDEQTQFFFSFLIIATACQTFLQHISCLKLKTNCVSSSIWCCPDFLALEMLQHVFACCPFLLPVDNHAVLCSLKLMAFTHVGCVFPATVTPLVPSRLTAMRWASVAASLVSPDPNVTAVLEDFLTSRRVAAHVSITSQATNRRFLQRVNSVWTHKWCLSTSWENKAHKCCISFIHTAVSVGSALFPRDVLKVVATSKPKSSICVYIFSNT